MSCCTCIGALDACSFVRENAWVCTGPSWLFSFIFSCTGDSGTVCHLKGKRALGGEKTVREKSAGELAKGSGNYECSQCLHEQ